MPNSETENDLSTIAASPASRVGRYELIHAIGRGAEAVVYRALDPVIGREVALKVMPVVGEDRRSLEARRREVRAVGKLRHPNIVTVHDAGEENGVFYIAFELIEGLTLEQLLVRGVQLPWSRAAELVASLADALQHAHDRGVIHRDLKPSNIMLADDGRVLLTDFGVARLADARLTTDGQVVGTPAFMAPEYLTGRTEPTPRCDLFSLAAVFFELLTGTRPFSGDTIYEVAKAIVEGPTPDPDDVVPELPPRLTAIVQRGLAKEPQQRQESAGELRDELHALLVEVRQAPVDDDLEWEALVGDLAAEVDRLGSDRTTPLPSVVSELIAPVESPAPGRRRPGARLALVLVPLLVLAVVALGALRSERRATAPGVALAAEVAEAAEGEAAAPGLLREIDSLEGLGSAVSAPAMRSPTEAADHPTAKGPQLDEVASPVPVELTVRLLSNAARGRLVVTSGSEELLARDFVFEREGLLRRRVEGQTSFPLELPAGRHYLEVAVERLGGRVDRAGLEASIEQGGGELWVKLDRRQGVVVWLEPPPAPSAATPSESTGVGASDRSADT